MTTPAQLARVANGAVIAVALWAAATVISIAGYLVGRWLDAREA